MSAAKWGLLAGAFQGVGAAAELSIQDRLEQAKEQRLREWQAELTRDQRAYEKGEKLDDREYEDSLRAVTEEASREGDKQTTTQRNAKGEIVGRKEAYLNPKTTKPVRVGDHIYDNGQFIKNPYAVEGGATTASTKPALKTITDENGVSQLVQVVTDENGMAAYVPVRAVGGDTSQPTYSPDDIRAAEDQAAKDVGGRMFGMVGGMDGDLIEQYGGEEAAIAYQKQKILAERQGKTFDVAPSAWRKRYLGEVATEPSGKGTPAERFAAEKQASKGDNGLLQPKSQESLFDMSAETNEPWGVTKGKEAIGAVKEAINDAPKRQAAQAKQSLDIAETRIKVGGADGILLQELNAIYMNELVPQDQRDRAKALFLKAQNR